VARYSKPLVAMNVKGDDTLYKVLPVEAETHVGLVTNYGMNWYPLDDVSIVGTKAAGVKAIALRTDEHLIDMFAWHELSSPEFAFFTDVGEAKRLNVYEFGLGARAKRTTEADGGKTKKKKRIAFVVRVDEDVNASVIAVHGEDYDTVPVSSLKPKSLADGFRKAFSIPNIDMIQIKKNETE
ncbi:MAG: DNA gyrase C-terminal beta-propeller domain-containing protein, partial [Bacilli bacterium]